RRQNKAVTLGNFSKVVNALSMIRVNGPDLFFNPQYLVFKMYINHSGPHLIKSTVNCDDYPAPEYEKGRELAIGNIPYVDVSATISEDEDNLYLAVINRHIAKSLHVAIRLKHWEPRQKGKRISLAGEDYMTENTFEFPERIKIEEEDFKNVTSSMDIIIPRHSVTIFEFYKGPEKI
ncbi:MAG: alpha-L-arabinofuranosidase C-terminal domain-containing protein, partial [Calditrichia bacterium]